MHFEHDAPVSAGRAPQDREPDAARIATTVAAAQRGDRDALRWLYQRFRPSVLAVVRRTIRDPHEAEDVTQQVFAKLLLVIGRYEPRGGSSFSSWLMTLARNAAVDQLRRRRDTLPEQALDDAVLDGPGPSSLRTAMSALPSAQRDVILLRHVVGLSPGEIAARMGRTESSVHGLHNRGRAALRRELCRLDAAPSVRGA